MKELCEYVKNKRKTRSAQHRELIKIYGECKGMGNRRYKVPQKSTFSKYKKYSFNARWR